MSAGRRFLTAPGLALLCMALLATPVCATDGIGRLFTSPGERQRLDALRERAGAPLVIEPVVEEDDPAPAAIVQKAPPPVVPSIRVDGIVRRSDGRSMAWVNGQSTLSGDFDSQHFEVETGRGDSVRVITPDHLPNVDLRPGQSWEPDANRIVDPRAGDARARP